MGRSWKTDQRDHRGAARAAAARRLGRRATTPSVSRRSRPSSSRSRASRRRSTRSTLPWCVASSGAHARIRAALERDRAARALRGPDLLRHRRRARQAGARPVPARGARRAAPRRSAAWSSRTRRRAPRRAARAGMDVLGYAGLTAPELLAAEGARVVRVDGRAPRAASTVPLPDEPQAGEREQVVDLVDAARSRARRRRPGRRSRSRAPRRPRSRRRSRIPSTIPA